MALSQGIPARFEIGFPLSIGKDSGDIAGYHCSDEFYDSQYGWVPVDLSEAWKDQSKKDYFFGAHDVNRMRFSMGRDLALNPPQAGGPLNYRNGKTSPTTSPSPTSEPAAPWRPADSFLVRHSSRSEIRWASRCTISRC
jgi:hypothetical protein